MKTEKSFDTRFVVPTVLSFAGNLYYFSQNPELNQANPPVQLLLDMFRIGIILGIPLTYDIAIYHTSQHDK